MPITNYDNGFANGVTIRGVPILNSYAGNIFYVDSGAGSDGNKGTYERPFATLDYAVGRSTPNNGDIIILKPGHAETVASAGAIAVDIAGVSIIGLGSGADRPTFTFSATASTITVSAASVTIENIITKPSIDSVVSPIVVSGADCWLDIEHQDASATVEAVSAVLTSAGADRLHIDLVYRGSTSGDACVNAVRLVGCDGGDINIDFYGVASTSIVEFHTTACSNIKVDGKFYNSGTTDLSKNVVDTVTGSTWSVTGFDAAAAASFSGGSGGAVAADDVGAITSTLGTVNATTTDSVHGKLGTDTEMADRSMYDLLVGAGPATFPSAAAAANDVSLAEVIRYISEQQAPRIVLKSSGDLTSFGTSKTLFTVTGDVMVRLSASVDVAVTSTSGTTTLEAGVTGNTACLLVQDAVDNTAFAIGDSWTLDTAADANGALMSAEWAIIGNGVDIILTGSVDDITAGDIDFYCEWKPLSSDGAVVAAA